MTIQTKKEQKTSKLKLMTSLQIQVYICFLFNSFISLLKLLIKFYEHQYVIYIFDNPQLKVILRNDFFSESLRNVSIHITTLDSTGTPNK